MSRKPKSPRVLDALRNCPFCKGEGWIRELLAPAKERDGHRVEYSAPMRRCSCTNPERRNSVAPAPAGIDQARKAAGERES